MKKTIILPAAITLLLLLGAAWVLSQTKAERKGLSRFLFAPDALIENRAQLQLTPEQVSSLRALMDTHLAEFRGRQRKAEEKARALADELSAGAANARTRHRELLDAERAVKELEFEVLLSARQLLTPAQLEKAQSMVDSTTASKRHSDHERITQKLEKLKSTVEKLEKAGRAPREHEAQLKQLQQLVRENRAAEAEALADQLLDLLAPPQAAAPALDAAGLMAQAERIKTKAGAVVTGSKRAEWQERITAATTAARAGKLSEAAEILGSMEREVDELTQGDPGGGELLKRDWLAARLPLIEEANAVRNAGDPIQALADGMAKEDETAIMEAVQAARARLGDGAGEPEVQDECLAVPADAKRLSRAEAHAAMQSHFRRIEQMKFWEIGCDPTTLQAPLRGPGSIIACMVAVDRAQLAGHEQALPVAREAADFLIWAQEQAGAGCYPFPAARDTSQERAMQVATRFLERAEAAGKLDGTVRNGWAFEDHGDGGLQFDNGECGLAMFELYEHTREPRFLASALKAADWAAARPLCTNWNYNSFSVALLAKAHQVTKEPKYLDAAAKKARLGVIPGQLTDGPLAGRWMDAHNARPAYHYIMMSALARLAVELPAKHADRTAVMHSLSLGLKTRNQEILTKGVMNKDKAMECLLLVSRLFRDNTAFLAETGSMEALDTLMRLASEQYRAGRLPLGPRGWGEMLEALAKQAGLPE